MLSILKLKTFNSKNFLILIFLLLIYVSFKCYVWQGYYKLFFFNSFNSYAKGIVTIIFQQPPKNYKNEFKPIQIEDKYYIFENFNSNEIKELFKLFPPPERVYSLQSQSMEQVEFIRGWISNILPEKTQNENIVPELVNAIEILGKNKFNSLQKKICSLNAKLFVQYLSGLKINSRMIQLNKHISVEVYNYNTKKWEMHDPFFNDTISFNNTNISAEEAFELRQNGVNFKFAGGNDIFDTVVIIPRTNFASYNPITFFGLNLDYFSYDNLSYWIPEKISYNTEEIWVKFYQMRKK